MYLRFKGKDSIIIFKIDKFSHINAQNTRQLRDQVIVWEAANTKNTYES